MIGRAKAIRLKCLDCSGGSPKNVTLCPVKDCPLWPYRFGYPETSKRYRERMKNAEKQWPEEYKDAFKG